MDRLGIMLHVVTQETENDQLLDEGALGPQRRLYCRELVARFGHHLALACNLGEENSNFDQQRKQIAEYIRHLDPYDHMICVHTLPRECDEVFEPLLGFPYFEGPSLNTKQTHQETLKWIELSAHAGRKWVVCLDELGPPGTGVKPDDQDPGHDEVRQQHLWGNLMAGGAGVEWYFGYNFAHDDLGCEDFRSRAEMWRQTRCALEFFHQYLPFSEMQSADELVNQPEAYCLAKPGEVYAIFLPPGGTARLELPAGKFDVRWYDSRGGGPLQVGGKETVSGPGMVDLGEAPGAKDRDWVVRVQRADD